MFLSTLTTRQEAFRREVGKITLRISRVEYQFKIIMIIKIYTRAYLEKGLTSQKSHGMVWQRGKAGTA